MLIRLWRLQNNNSPKEKKTSQPKNQSQVMMKIWKCSRRRVSISEIRPLLRGQRGLKDKLLTR